MNKTTGKSREFHPLAVGYACLIYLFLFLPIFVVILFSFNSSARNIMFEHFTLEWYGRMFQNRQLMEAFWNTILVAFASTLIAVVIGTLCAVGLHKFEFKLKQTINQALYIPIVIPELVFAIAMLVFFTSLNVEMSLFTLIVSHVTFSMPFVVITVRARIAGFDQSIEEAARDLGANEWHTFYRVTLPMILPGVISGGMLALTISLDDVVVSYFTAGLDSTTLPLKILGMVKKGISPDVNALSTLMIIGTVGILFLSTAIQNHLERKQDSRTSSTGMSTPVQSRKASAP
ncbi:MAG: ABC transporter permease [Lachnospiraceae bacterium]|nr:ABC transporter permease [Lachnospiraceae bacterium]